MRVPRSFTNLRIQTADETCPRCSRRMLEKTTSNVHGIMDVCLISLLDAIEISYVSTCMTI